MIFTRAKYTGISVYNTIKYKVFNKRNFPMLSLYEICDTLGFDIKSLGDFAKYGNKKFFICNKKMFYLKRSLVFASVIENKSVANTIIKQGGLIISETPNLYSRQITVDSETDVYIQLCSKCRIDSSIIIAVTGSTGKTSAKQFINHVLKAHVSTFCETHNMNTYRFIGSLLQLSNKKNRVIVQEVDEGDPYVVDYASKMLRPNISVITNIGLSHLQNFGTQETILQNIAEIENHMGQDSLVIFNYDDYYLRNYHWNQNTLSFSVKDKNADCYCAEYHVLDNGHLSFVLAYKNKMYDFELPIPGEHNIYNAMCAFLCGTLLGEKEDLIKYQLSTFSTSGVRQNLIKSKKSILYVDCFNAAPSSVKFAIDTLCSLKGYSQRIAVLSDMYEFGDATEKIHRDVGKYIQTMNKKNHLDIVLCYGESAKYIADEIERNDIKVFSSIDKSEIVCELKKYTNQRNAILFKGSRGTHLEFYIKKVFPMAYFKVFFSDILLFHDI